MISKKDREIIEEIICDSDNEKTFESIEKSFSKQGKINNSDLMLMYMNLELFIIKRHLDGNADELENFVELRVKWLVKQLKDTNKK